MFYIHEKYITENKIDVKTLSADLQQKLAAFTAAKAVAAKIKDKKKKVAEIEDLELTSKDLLDDIAEELDEEDEKVSAATKKEEEEKAAAEAETERLRIEAEEAEKKKVELEKKKEKSSNWFGIGVFTVAAALLTTLGIQISRNGKK